MVIALKVKNSREYSIQQRHPWLFSGALESGYENTVPGSLVQLVSHAGKILGYGHYQSESIAVKLFAFGETSIDEDFWLKRIEDAIELRTRLGLPNSETNAYRLVHGEGDLLPGLIVDIYGDAAVIEFHSAGMRALAELFKGMLLSRVPGIKRALVRDADEPSLSAEEQIVTFLEDGLKYSFNFTESQKTGYFLDQRENRQAVEAYASGNTVLDCFSYSGGFTLHALRGGAKKVTTVDASDKALSAAAQNLQANFSKTECEQVEFVKADCLEYLHNIPKNTYDLIVLDPPAFVKSGKALKGGSKGYETINRLAMAAIKSGGLLYTFSCSQRFSTQLFEETVKNAALRVNRSARILQRFTQSPCHPVNCFHPEGAYLKGLLLQISK